MTQSQSADSTPAVTVRPVERADLLSVYRIEKSVFPQPWPFSALESHLDADAFLVAVTDRPSADGVDAVSVVGYVIADRTPNGGVPFGHVKDLAVRPDHRRQGVGALLLQNAVDRLVAAGVSDVRLEVRRGNEAARALYERFGFSYHRTAPRYYEDGEDALVYLREV